MAGTTQARADIISYNMTGTITSASGSSSFAAGDHVTWTLQYAPSSPRTSGGVNSAGPWSGYSIPQTNMITNIVDQTTGYHFSLLPPSDTYSGGIGLQNNNPSSYQHYPSGDIFVYENGVTRGINTSISLKLRADGYLPTLNLANLQINNLTLTSNQEYTSLNYNYLTMPSGVQPAFTADGYLPTLNLANLQVIQDPLTRTGPSSRSR
jgi:hypothetical protein